MAHHPFSTRVRRPLHRRSPLAAATGLVLLGSLLAPGAALAADTISMTVEARDLSPDSAAGVSMSTAAKPAYVGYTVAFTNGNTSTLTQIVLTIADPVASKGSATGSGSYVDTAPNGDGACQPVAAGVRCTLDQLKPGDGFNRTFIFRTPAYDGGLIDGVLSFPTAGTVLSVKEGTNDSGARTDTFVADRALSTTLRDVVVGTGGREDDYFSTYTLPSGGTVSTSSVNNEQNTNQLDATNRQSTKVTIPSTPRGTEATIEELVGDACPSGVTTCFGQLSQMTIPDLQAGDKIVVFIRWNASSIPPGITNRNLKVAWDASDVGASWIVVTATCNSTASNAPCRYPTVRFKDKDLGVKLVLPHNGRIRGL